MNHRSRAEAGDRRRELGPAGGAEWTMSVTLKSFSMLYVVGYSLTLILTAPTSGVSDFGHSNP